MAIWITGLPGSGKSTAADAIKEMHPAFIILRMDEMRKIVTPEPTYSDSERDIVYRAMVYLAMTLTGLGRDVIIDATGNRRKWRELARRLIPRYAEVYLACPIQTCIERERKRTDAREAPRDIYQKGAAGRPVPGLTVPYEEPLTPEITVYTDKDSLREIVAKIEAIISGLKEA